jgi:hypothetical protein
VEMSLDEHGVDRIIEAVGRRYIPPTLDRFTLRRAIQESDRGAEILSAHRHGARSRKQLERLKQVSGTAKQLAALLEAKDDASEMIESLCGEWPRAMVSRLIDYVEALVEVLSGQGSSQWDNPTANEWLAGVELPCVFASIFAETPAARGT